MYVVLFVDDLQSIQFPGWTISGTEGGVDRCECIAYSDTPTTITNDLAAVDPRGDHLTNTSWHVSNKTVTFSLDNPDVREMAGRPAISTPSAFSQS